MRFFVFGVQASWFDSEKNIDRHLSALRETNGETRVN